MAELKTKKNSASVTEFIGAIQDESKKKDAQVILKMMKQATKKQPKMWGSSIIGFGDYHYKYASGREGDWFAVGFSPRKQNLTLYISGGLDSQKELLKKLGKHTIGVGCIYIKKLDDVDTGILEQIIAQGVKQISK